MNTRYVWNQGWRGERKIIYTGNMPKSQTRYMKFLNRFKVLTAGATFVMVVKILVLMFGV